MSSARCQRACGACSFDSSRRAKSIGLGPSAWRSASIPASSPQPTGTSSSGSRPATREDLYLPAERHSHRRPAAARARCGHRSPLQPLSDALLPHARRRRARAGAFHGGTASFIPVAGKRAWLKNIAERVTVRNHRLRPIRPDMLPAEIRQEATGRGADAPSASANPSAQANPVNAVPHHPAADAAWNEMVIEGKSFWLAVHPLFIERELTKTDVREIIRRGLRQTQGSYGSSSSCSISLRPTTNASWRSSISTTSLPRFIPSASSGSCPPPAGKRAARPQSVRIVSTVAGRSSRRC